MNPVLLYVRGIKMTVSNLELPLVLWAALHLAVILCLVPVAAAVGLTAFAVGGTFSGETGADLGLHLLEWMVDHLALVLGGNLLLWTWVGLVLFCFLYLEAGVLGMLVRAHRAAPRDDVSLRPRLGFSPAMRVFRFADLKEEVMRQGWRVTMLATLYSLAGLVIMALVCSHAVAAILLALRRPAAIPFAAASFAALLLVILVVISALTLHYRYALLCAVMGQSGARRAMRGATLVFRERPLQVLTLFLLSVGFSLTLGVAALAVNVPLGLLSLVPVVGLGLLLPRLLLSMVEGFLMQGLWVATLGAMLPLCEGAAPDPGLGAPSPAPSAGTGV